MINWKLIAIILMIICAIESLGIGYFFALGNQIVQNENECAINICADYEAYQFDYIDNICYCFEDGLVAKTRVIK